MSNLVKLIFYLNIPKNIEPIYIYGMIINYPILQNSMSNVFLVNPSSFQAGFLRKYLEKSTCYEFETLLCILNQTYNREAPFGVPVLWSYGRTQCPIYVVHCRWVNFTANHIRNLSLHGKSSELVIAHLLCRSESSVWYEDLTHALSTM